MHCPSLPWARRRLQDLVEKSTPHHHWQNSHPAPHIVKFILHHFCILMPKPLELLVANVTLAMFQPLNHISTFKIPPNLAPTSRSPMSRIRNQELPRPGSPPSMGAFPQHENAHKTDLICIESLESPCQGPHCNLFSLLALPDLIAAVPVMMITMEKVAMEDSDLATIMMSSVMKNISIQISKKSHTFFRLLLSSSACQSKCCRPPV